MSKKHAKQRNPVVDQRLREYAQVLGLEIVEYKHVTVKRLPYVYGLLRELRNSMESSHNNVGAVEDKTNGVKVSVRLLPQKPVVVTEMSPLTEEMDRKLADRAEQRSALCD